jgi:hypothetical protein
MHAVTHPTTAIKDIVDLVVDKTAHGGALKDSYSLMRHVFSRDQDRTKKRLSEELVDDPVSDIMLHFACRSPAWGNDQYLHEPRPGREQIQRWIDTIDTTA